MPAREPFYYITGEWYKGNLPAFFAADEFPMTRLLEKNSKLIIDEIKNFYAQDRDKLATNFVPYNVDATGWKTMVLYSYGIVNKQFLRYLPQTWNLLKDYPGLSLVMVSVLNPGVRLKAHFGDTDAIIRNHLGVEIPAGPPVTGIRIRNVTRGWQVGKVLSFCVLNRHYAWNFSDKPRIVLIVDFIRPEFLARQKEIQGKVLAAEGMKWIATRIPVLKKIPRRLTLMLLDILGVTANIYVRIFRRHRTSA